MRKAYDSKNCDLGIDAPLKCAKCPRFPKSNDNDVKNIKYNAPVVHKNLLRQFPLKTLIPGLSHLPPTNTYAKVITQTCRRNRRSAQRIGTRAIQNVASIYRRR
ncbi:hypothetical protein CEXT_518211 [Caerostris extrusa]|uniref:Uncharacterized protein n=1 Tax=Caerostris extrusa TaxID=172846 RepID=A0AAV4NU41_CAEEX|nr:hypothetical protein CEXT_518211 [Caerostris extrusa]